MVSFPDDFLFNPPASAGDILDAEKALHVSFPEDYRQLLAEASGGEGPVGSESFLRLWPVHELAQFNEDYKLDVDYAPDLVFIGTDGGNEVYAYRPRDASYVSAPFIGMSPDEVQVRGPSFTDFLESFP